MCFRNEQVFFSGLARVCQLGLINDPNINFQKSLNGLNDHKERENINHTSEVRGDIL